MSYFKFFAFSILGFFFCHYAGASAPRECVGSDAEIKEALTELGINAKLFVSEHGELPGPWSTGISRIISDSPTARAIGGNVSPGFDGESIELTCSDLKLNVHRVYSVNINTLDVSKREFTVITESQ